MEPEQTFRGREQTLASNDQGKDPAKRRKNMEGSNAMQAKASHISSPEEQSVLRGILEAHRSKSKGDDDTPERRHKRTQDRERTPTRSSTKESEYV